LGRGLWWWLSIDQELFLVSAKSSR
jgi:hypothetical protein